MTVSSAGNVYRETFPFIQTIVAMVIRMNWMLAMIFRSSHQYHSSSPGCLFVKSDHDRICKSYRSPGTKGEIQNHIP